MSEEQPVEPAVQEVKPKQFLLMVDELSMAFLTRLVPSMKYVEVEGMTMVDHPKHQLLVNPLPLKIEDADVTNVKPEAASA